MRALISLVLMGLSLNAVAATKVRIGWQVPWSIQGQIVQIWKHTDILKKHDIEAEFIGKNYGPELNEIALAGAIDVILTADQPAAALFSKDKGWVGISRLMYNRTVTYVPPKSPITKLVELKDKTVGVPFGAAAQRVINENLKAAGVDPKEVKFINLGMAEHGPLVKKAGADVVKWDQFDALSGFDPIPSILESKGLVRTIDTGKVCSMVLMNKEFLAKDKKIAKNLQAALIEAYAFYRKNLATVDAWFLEEAKLEGADTKALEIAAALEPNLKVKKDKDIKVKFSKEDFEIMQKGADFVGIASGKNINMKDFVSNDYVK